MTPKGRYWLQSCSNCGVYSGPLSKKPEPYVETECGLCHESVVLVRVFSRPLRYNPDPMPWAPELCIFPTIVANEHPNRLAFWDDGEFDYLRPVAHHTDPESDGKTFMSEDSVIEGQNFPGYVPVKVRATLVPRYMYSCERCGEILFAPSKAVTSGGGFCKAADGETHSWVFVLDEAIPVSPDFVDYSVDLQVISLTRIFPAPQTNKGHTKGAADSGGFTHCSFALMKDAEGEYYLQRVRNEPMPDWSLPATYKKYADIQVCW
jgi:ribosomal protein L37E